MKKFRMKVVCEATFVVTSPFAIEIEAEDEEAAEERAEELIRDFMETRDEDPLLDVARHEWEAQAILNGHIGQKAIIEFDDYQDMYLRDMEETTFMKGVG